MPEGGCSVSICTVGCLVRFLDERALCRGGGESEEEVM